MSWKLFVYWFLAHINNNNSNKFNVSNILLLLDGKFRRLFFCLYVQLTIFHSHLAAM